MFDSIQHLNIQTKNLVEHFGPEINRLMDDVDYNNRSDKPNRKTGSDPTNESAMIGQNFNGTNHDGELDGNQDLSGYDEYVDCTTDVVAALSNNNHQDDVLLPTKTTLLDVSYAAAVASSRRTPGRKRSLNLNARPGRGHSELESTDLNPIESKCSLLLIKNAPSALSNFDQVSMCNGSTNSYNFHR